MHAREALKVFVHDDGSRTVVTVSEDGVIRVLDEGAGPVPMTRLRVLTPQAGGGYVVLDAHLEHRCATPIDDLEDILAPVIVLSLPASIEVEAA